MTLKNAIGRVVAAEKRDAKPITMVVRCLNCRTAGKVGVDTTDTIPACGKCGRTMTVSGATAKGPGR